MSILLADRRRQHFESFRPYRRDFQSAAKRAEQEGTKPAQSRAEVEKEKAEFRRKRKELKRLLSIPPEFRDVSDPKLREALVAEGRKKAKAEERQKHREVRRLIRQLDGLREFQGLARGPNLADNRRALGETMENFLTSDYMAEVMKAPPTKLPASWVVEALSWKLEQMAAMVARLAQGGEPGALFAIAQSVRPMISAMNRIVMENPRLLRGMPHQVPDWPVMKSLHQDFDEDHEALLSRLEVGKGLPVVIAKEARWTIRDTTGRWAIQLVSEVESVRQDIPMDFDPKWFVAATRLEPFSSESWLKWWEVIREMLREVYIDVVEIPELVETVTSKADRRTPGRIRSRIVKNLKDKIRSLAGLNKV